MRLTLSGPLNISVGKSEPPCPHPLMSKREASCAQVDLLRAHIWLARLSLSVCLGRCFWFLQEPSEPSDTWKSDQMFTLNME